MDSAYSRNRAFFGEPYLLTPEQVNDPIAAIYSFFDSMHLWQVREYLDVVKEALLTCEHHQFKTPRDREDVIYTFGLLEELAEAAWLVMPKDPLEEKTTDNSEQPAEDDFDLSWFYDCEVQDEVVEFFG